MTARQNDTGFADRLNDALIRTGTVLCVGIDAHPGLMPAVFGGAEQAAGSEDALRHLRAFTFAVIEAAAGRVPAVKPQAAFFEAMGRGAYRFWLNAAKPRDAACW